MKTYLAIILTLILASLVAIAVLIYKKPLQYAPLETVSNETEEVGNTDILQKPSDKPIDTKTDLVAPVMNGAVSGKLCYPSEAIPELTIYLKNITTEKIYSKDTVANQQTYMFENVPAGTYNVFAYIKDPKSIGADDFGGGYTQAVPCGLTVSCTDHTLIDVIVKSEKTTTNADVCDWYGAIIPARP